VQQLSATLDQELTEIANALQNATPTQAEVDEVAQKVRSLRDRVQTIIP
jgi:polyhydroxyalkanoate synthesis regulator phasin